MPIGGIGAKKPLQPLQPLHGKGIYCTRPPPLRSFAPSIFTRAACFPFLPFDIQSFDVPSPLESAAAAFRAPENEVRNRFFPVPTRGLSVQRKKDLLKRGDRGRARVLIRPENADVVIELMPENQEETLHAVVCGDFVFCDLIVRIAAKMGNPHRITLTTLSLSMKNIDALAGLMASLPQLKVEMLLSHYFQSTSKEIFGALEKLLLETFSGRFSLSIGRSHAKVAIFEAPDQYPIIIETSANLRSSGNIEQLAIFRGCNLAEFHRKWILEFQAATAADA
jgi:hypothetical protein